MDRNSSRSNRTDNNNNNHPPYASAIINSKGEAAASTAPSPDAGDDGETEDAEPPAIRPISIHENQENQEEDQDDTSSISNSTISIPEDLDLLSPEPSTPKLATFLLLQEDDDATERSPVPLAPDLQLSSTPNAHLELHRQVALAWPIVLTYILEYLPTLSCIVFVGHLDVPGHEAQRYVDAAMLSNTFINLTCVAIGFGMATALDTLCAQANGAHCQHLIGIYLQTGILVVGTVFIPLLLLNWFAEPVLVLMGQDPAIAELAGEFSHITVFSLPFLLLYEMLRKLLQAQNTVRPMVLVVIVGDIVNLVAGYVLTYKTSLGFHGAAVARALGNVTLPVALILYLCYSKTYQSWWFGWRWHEAIAQVPSFLRLGIPGACMMMMEWWSFEMLAPLAGLLPRPELVLSTHAVLVSLGDVLYMAYVGTSVATSIRVGNALGANRPQHAKMACRIALSISLSTAVVLATIVLTFRYQIPKLLISDEHAVHNAGHLMFLFAAYTMAEAASCVMQGIYRGLGRQNAAAKSNAFGYYVVGFPLAVLLAFGCHWGLAGLWTGSGVVGTSTTFAVLATLLCKADWQQLADEAQDRIE